jgi:hypothetical protein
MDIEVIDREGVNWIYLAGCGEYWRAVVNTVMKFMVL